MSYYVYILYSIKLERYYIGATQDVVERLKKHLWSTKGFTAKAKDWEVKYSEEYSSKAEAYQRERQIKSWKSCQMIVKLILRSG